MITSVAATAPCRVDLAGGTLDIWPLGLLHPGARTVNVAIDVEVRVSLRGRERGWSVEQNESRIAVDARDELLASPESALVGLVAEHFDLPPFEVELESASPRGAGLGASSALAVALIAAARARDRRGAVGGGASTVHLARDLEARLMQLPTGIQDHYPALLGGALEIRHRPGGEEVRRLPIDLEQLGRSLLVAYSGGSHLSAANNFEVVALRLRGDRATVDRLSAIAEAAGGDVVGLERGDLAGAGRAMTAEWSARRELGAGGVDAGDRADPRRGARRRRLGRQGVWRGRRRLRRDPGAARTSRRGRRARSRCWVIRCSTADRVGCVRARPAALERVPASGTALDGRWARSRGDEA